MSVTLERGGEGERLGARARWAVEIPSPHKNAANRDIPRLLPHENGFGLSENPNSTSSTNSCGLVQSFNVPTKEKKSNSDPAFMQKPRNKLQISIHWKSVSHPY